MSASKESKKPLHDRLDRVARDFFELWIDCTNKRGKGFTYDGWTPYSVGAELAPPTFRYRYTNDAGSIVDLTVEPKDMLREIDLAIYGEKGRAGEPAGYRF